MLRCAITDRKLYPGNEAERQAALVLQAKVWAEQGIEMIQLREKDLLTPALAALACRMREAIGSAPTMLIVNSNVEAAVAAKAQGVHLTSGPGGPMAMRVVRRYAAAGLSEPLITVSCHNLEEIEHARAAEVDAILFAPVFGKIVAGKTVTPAAGLGRLREACQAAGEIPVLALGGVTLGRAKLCLDAGAAGVAGIRLFLSPSGSMPRITA